MAVVVVVGGIDTAINWDKAYGNVSVNGVSVGGKTAAEIQGMLQDAYAQRLSHARITIYADEEAEARGKMDLSEEERIAIAEEISTEEAVATIGSWATDALSLKANIPYEQIAEEAVELGRGDGGLGERLSLLVTPRNIDVSVQFDEGLLETLAGDIDRTIGDPRVDATVSVESGTARAVEGHAGTMVDRSWLANKISDAMMYEDAPDEFVAQAESAQSRISIDRAREVATSVNRAIENGALFVYEGKSWLATPADLGDWTSVSVVQTDAGTWDLDVNIDSSAAIPAVVKGAGATITSDDMLVAFEKSGGSVLVRTSGSGKIPEVAPAVAELNEKLFGEAGTAWGNGDGKAVQIDIAESDRPETMSFDDALNVGVISVIGEYTTEFSNQEGTENRNHNIKLCADILNDSIVNSNGGEWVFNDRSGDTNEEAGFWSAGSIVNGEYIDSIGGGICQVATTIFNAVYEAGLDITERHNHTLYIASYPTGRDAAVSYPDLDLAWKNGLKSDVLLKLSYTDTSVTAQLYSVYTGYSTETDTGQWEEGARYTTEFELDDSLSDGLYYMKTVGEDGSKISIERTVSDDKGNVVKTDAFTSQYSPKNEVYVIGPGVDTSQLVRSAPSTSSATSSSSLYDTDYSDIYGAYGSGYGSLYGSDDTVWY